MVRILAALSGLVLTLERAHRTVVDFGVLE
jgi:hypothetical protein